MFMTETIAINPSWPLWLQIVVLIMTILPVAWAIYEKIQKGDYKAALGLSLDAIESNDQKSVKLHVKRNANPRHTQIINNVLKEKGYLNKEENGDD